ncbi:hypothetical protein [Aquimarina pacifica]|uniref:hypothetical protein n=1 Tax=Aquimarina pacifica TaxID=1296415 RepID=UPI00047122DC|nr:hypothetical protein [Aquimarina pacifica]
MKTKYINSSYHRYILFVFITLASTLGWGQDLTGGLTGTRSDFFIINSDESENDAGIRLQTREGESYSDWTIWTDSFGGELNISSWRNTFHNDDIEYEPGDTRLSIHPDTKQTILYNALSIGNDVIKGNSELSVFGVTYISEKNQEPRGFNVGSHADNYLLWVETGIVSDDLAIINVEHWSDHVFEENYELKDLDALEEFIKKNGHLPNIPSEKEILKEGYSIHDMNARFLEKIEELTLYSIEQNKKINALLKAQGLQDQIKQSTTQKN